MHVLVINSGSSSIKYELINSQTEQGILRGIVEKIGEAGSALQHTQLTEEQTQETLYQEPFPTHRDGLTRVLELILKEESISIDAIGHRVVHGGESFSGPVLVDDSVIETIRQLIPLAPLHNPSNLLGIELLKELLPQTPQVAVFDTSFHMTIPPKTHRYAIPRQYYESDRIRKYGMHGTSHAYVAQQAAFFMDQDLSELKLITLHLGNGCSATAVDRGRSIETSMGLTPLEGLMMGTRSGDLDPAVLIFLSRKHGMSPDELDRMLNRESGLLGICGANDLREIVVLAEQQDTNAQLALEMFVHRIKKYIGAYYAILGGADALVFTAGIGERSALIREMICHGLEHMGFEIDPQRNHKHETGAGAIHSEGSRSSLLVIPTNEELAISQSVTKLVS